MRSLSLSSSDQREEAEEPGGRLNLTTKSERKTPLTARSAGLSCERTPQRVDVKPCRPHYGGGSVRRDLEAHLPSPASPVAVGFTTGKGTGRARYTSARREHSVYCGLDGIAH